MPNIPKKRIKKGIFDPFDLHKRPQVWTFFNNLGKKNNKNICEMQATETSELKLTLIERLLTSVKAGKATK